MRKGRDGKKKQEKNGKKTGKNGKKTGKKQEKNREKKKIRMKIVATTSLPAVARPNTDRWNFSCS